MTHTITLSTDMIKQILWAVDLAENTLEGLSDAELASMHIDIDREALFGLADDLEELVADKVQG
jgi:hypothetical protein